MPNSLRGKSARVVVTLAALYCLVDVAMAQYTPPSGGGSASWGSIGGTLSNQSDLNAALSGKIPTGGAAGSVSGTTASAGSAYATITPHDSTHNSNFYVYQSGAANPSSNPRDDEGLVFSYNYTKSRVNTGDHAFFLGIESAYGAAGSEQLESYFQFLNTSGTVSRPLEFICYPTNSSAACDVQSKSTGLTFIALGAATEYAVSSGVNLHVKTFSSDVVLDANNTDQLYVRSGSGLIYYQPTGGGFMFTVDTSGVVRGYGGYKAADGTVGATVTTCTAFKNGLCVSGT